MQADCAEATDAERAECEALIDSTAGWLARCGLDRPAVVRRERLGVARQLEPFSPF